MRINQEKKLKSRRKKINLWEWMEIFENLRRVVFVSAKLFIKFVNKLFSRRAIFLRPLVFVLIISWIFSGWPQIWQNPPFPPGIQKARAAVAFGATSESHTGTTGASDTFYWTHSGGGAPRGVLVFVFNRTVPTVGVNDIASVTYGGVELPLIGVAIDITGSQEGGSTQAYFLGSGIPTGDRTVEVTKALGRTYTNAYAVAITVTANNDTDYTGLFNEEENQALTEENVSDGSTGINSVRFAGILSGLGAVPSAGANSTLLQGIDFGAFVNGVYRETNAGQGSRPVGASAATDDVAAIYLAIRELPTVALSGTVTASITEADIVAGGETVILTSTGNYVPNTITTPVVGRGGAGGWLSSGNNTVSASWNVSTPAMANGDLLIMFLGWDNSATVTGVTVANGPNSEVWQQINSVVASASTEVRMTAYYVVATGAWSAGTIAVTPNASEQWTATVVKVPAGEFDATTPIGANATRASAGVTETSVLMPAFSAGSTDGGGKLIWAGIADADPQTTLASGYTSIESIDRGAESLSAQTRDAAVTNSESLSGGTRAIASDSWASLAFIVRAPTVAPFANARQAIINGLDSAQSEGTGWDAVVKAGQNVSGVARTSDTVVTITLDAFASYDITAQETITATIPATALVSGSAAVATPTFNITAVGFSSAIEIRAQDYTTSVTTIAFPQGAPGATVSQPYNDINGSGSPQTFGGAGTAKPVVTLYNGGGATLTIWYNITTFTNGVVSSENYLVNTKGAACADESCITNAATFDADTTTGTTIATGAGNEKDIYLKVVLSSVAGKSGNSTLTILGEAQ